MNVVVCSVSHSLYPCFSGVLGIKKKTKQTKKFHKKFEEETKSSRGETLQLVVRSAGGQN